MRILLVTADLTVVSRVEGAAGLAGATLRTTSIPQQLADWCATGPTDLVIVDLAIPAIDIDGLVKAVRNKQSRGPRIVAFGPHVQKKWLAAARNADCDEVVSRGHFFSQLDAMVGRESPAQ
jgi:DNA-binding response OmpR family regulator